MRDKYAARKANQTYRSGTIVILKVMKLARSNKTYIFVLLKKSVKIFKYDIKDDEEEYDTRAEK